MKHPHSKELDPPSKLGPAKRRGPSLSDDNHPRQHIRLDPAGASLEDLPDLEQLEIAIERGTIFDAAPFAVLMIEIDDLRGMRAVQGNLVANALPRAVAARLGRIIANRGILTTAGTGAFAIGLPGASPETADALAQDLLAAIRRPFELHRATVYVTASIGIAQQQGDARATTDPGLVIRHAEAAGFAAHSAGGNRRQLFCPAMDARQSRRGRMVQDLRHALHTNQCSLAFQPKFSLPDELSASFSLETGQAPAQCRLVGAEALMRWTSPALGHVSPEEFIPLAEANGMISMIDFHVMELFAQQLGRWRASGYDLPASVNLSPLSFEDDALAQHLLNLLKYEGVAPDSVTVEITEMSLMSMSPQVLDNLDRFRRAGITLSVDDFGTGYSSFSYLQKLIVSEIKIDRSFVRGLVAESVDSRLIDETTGHLSTATIVKSIMAMARSLDLHVIAEGVENVAQLEWLHAAGCREFQGFLGGHAVQPDKFEELYLGEDAKRR